MTYSPGAIPPAVLSPTLASTEAPPSNTVCPRSGPSVSYDTTLRSPEIDLALHGERGFEHGKNPMEEGGSGGSLSHQEEPAFPVRPSGTVPRQLAILIVI